MSDTSEPNNPEERTSCFVGLSLHIAIVQEFTSLDNLASLTSLSSNKCGLLPCPFIHL
jgi:hypothetical protein